MRHAMDCAEKAVKHWREFPLSSPRPIVLLDSAVASREGFATVDASDALRYGTRQVE